MMLVKPNGETVRNYDPDAPRPDNAADSRRTVPIDNINVGDRVRRDLGDVDALAKSINAIGLIQPIVITPDGTLLAGQRRLEAVKRLGWGEIPAVTLETTRNLWVEHDENVLRKDFSPSEAVALARTTEDQERKRARERQIEGGRTGGQASRK